MQGNRSLMVLAVVAAVFLLDLGEPFFVPLFLALFISYALSPVVRALTALVRWRTVAAAIVVFSLIGLVAVSAWSWSDDVQALWEEVPTAAKTVSKTVQKLVQPSGAITEVKKAAADIESVAQTGKAAPKVVAAPPANSAAQVSIWQLLWAGWKGVMFAGSQVMVVLFLVFFMLSSGDLFKRKLIAIGALYNKKRFTQEVIEEIDDQVRRYLVVLLVANVLVGLGTWLAFWALGVKYPGLWGLIAGILHTAPYFGPAIIAVGSLLASLVQTGEWTRALLVSGSSILVATLVGQLFATWLASRSTNMNTTAAFTGLLFFGWIWGLWGILLGIPLLAIVKTICEHNEDWKPVAELLGR